MECFVHPRRDEFSPSQFSRDFSIVFVGDEKGKQEI